MAEEQGTVPKELLPVSESASAHAPVIFFDSVATYGFGNGVANLSLEVIRFMPSGNSTVPDRVVVAHLKMSAAAYASLKLAIAALDAQHDSAKRKPMN